MRWFRENWLGMIGLMVPVEFINRQTVNSNAPLTTIAILLLAGLAVSLFGNTERG